MNRLLVLAGARGGRELAGGRLDGGAMQQTLRRLQLRPAGAQQGQPVADRR